MQLAQPHKKVDDGVAKIAVLLITTMCSLRLQCLLTLLRLVGVPRTIEKIKGATPWKQEVDQLYTPYIIPI